MLAALPHGAASRSVSLRLNAPDELFFLRSQGSPTLRSMPGLLCFFQPDLPRS